MAGFQKRHHQPRVKLKAQQSHHLISSEAKDVPIISFDGPFKNELPTSIP